MTSSATRRPSSISISFASSISSLRCTGLVLIDDGRARRHAAMLGVIHTGTLGVLIKARRQGMIPRLAPLLDKLGDLGFRMGAALREKVLAQVGEAP